MKINARLLAPDVALSLWSLLHYEIASKKKKKKDPYGWRKPNTIKIKQTNNENLWHFAILRARAGLVKKWGKRCASPKYSKPSL